MEKGSLVFRSGKGDGWEQRRWFLAGVLVCGICSAGCGSSGDSSSSGDTGQSAEVPGETDIIGSVSQMEKGDILLLSFADGKTSLDFSGASSGTDYLLILQEASATAGTGSATLGDESLGMTGLAKALGVASPRGPQEELEALLRAAEMALADSGEATAVADVGVGKAVAKAVTTGSSATFRVLSSLSSTTAYTEVTATARCVNARVALFADTAIDRDLSGVMSSSDYDTLCAQFKTALDTEFSILGDPPDINGDESITVLMTPQVNSLGGSGGGIVTGFFFAGDLLKQGTSNPASNEREVVFVLAPDPDGVFGTALSKDFTMGNLLTAVVPHEVQHLLSYYQHVITNKGSAEATWLNEAMSHLMEDVTGYGQENPSRVALYLQSSRESPLIPSGSPDLSERGGSYLFLRFLYEQASSGNTFLNGLVNTSRSGVENLLAAFGTSNSNLDEFAEFLQRWGVAVGATNANITTDARYIYKARAKNTTTDHWEGVCLICDAEDGRNTTLAGPTKTTYTAQTVSVRNSGSGFFSFASIPATLAVTGTASGTWQGILLRTK